MNGLNELRRKAEQISRNDNTLVTETDFSNLSYDELKTLAQDLKIYQIELEMQNDELLRTQLNLTSLKEEYKTLFELAPVGYFIINQLGLISDVNVTGCNLLKNNKAKLLHQSLLTYIENSYKNLFNLHINSVIKHKIKRQDEIKIYREDGYIFHALIESSIYINSDNDAPLIRLILTDIEEIHQMQAQAHLSEKIIENSIEGILITDRKGHILTVNKTFTKITGYSKEEAIGKTPSILRSGKHDKEFYQRLWQTIKNEGFWEGEIWNRREDGEVYLEWLCIREIKDDQGHFYFYVGKFSDLTTIKDTQTRLHFLAHFDVLTQLPNRTLFNDRLSQAIMTAERSKNKVVLFFMDLDGFKDINDSLGHDSGDILLQQVAKRLLSTVRKMDTVSRLGGDEFTIIANDIVNTDQIITLAEKILNALSEPFIIDKRKFFIGASIGISTFPDDAINGSDLVQYADTAMYQAKENGKNQFCFYTQRMGDMASERMQLEHELNVAIEQNQLVLHYQPQYHIETGDISGMEALVRWYHPQRGLILPTEFIPEAEKTNLILLLGEWVLNSACAQAQKWLQAGKENIQIAINISAKQFQQPGFDEEIKQLLLKHDIAGDNIELEITEKSLITDIDKVLSTLHNLKAMGISIAIDDFGTGYSSMNYLKRLPLDVLKIDRSFIKDIDIESVDEAIIKSILALAQGLNLKVVAEGIETQFQRELLSQLKCNYAQGFLYNKAITVEEISMVLD
ncbi:MAG: EAL domain-containing protein [Gammaproteobacteria bacterium]|nr:EAL domain-containing protein [Gammaproteobacteria bacterium]